MPFEVFNKRAAMSSKIPMVTIQKDGEFSMNKAAFDAIGEPEAVELLYDSEEELIAFRPAPAEKPLAFPVKPQGRNSPGRQVAGKAFARYYELDVSVARRYSVRVQDGMLVVDLKSDSAVVTGPRAAMKSRLGVQ